jgi:hypothetical protein
MMVQCVGVMRNTRPLNRSASMTHIVEVVAVDCGMRRSQPVLVTINVQPALCTRTFKGNKYYSQTQYICNLMFAAISERVEYYGGSGARYLMPQAEVSACLEDTNKCTLEGVSAVVRLHADHIGRGGCDREAYLSSRTLKTFVIAHQCTDNMCFTCIGAMLIMMLLNCYQNQTNLMLVTSRWQQMMWRIVQRVQMPVKQR